MPRENIEALAKAPPTKRSKSPKRSLEWDCDAPDTAAASTPGMVMCEPSL